VLSSPEIAEFSGSVPKFTVQATLVLDADPVIDPATDWTQLSMPVSSSLPYS